MPPRASWHNLTPPVLHYSQFAVARLSAVGAMRRNFFVFLIFFANFRPIFDQFFVFRPKNFVFRPKIVAFRPKIVAFRTILVPFLLFFRPSSHHSHCTSHHFRTILVLFPHHFRTTPTAIPTAIPPNLFALSHFSLLFSSLLLSFYLISWNQHGRNSG